MVNMNTSQWFCFYKLGLILLNIVYMIVGLTLVVIPAGAKLSAVFTSWPIVGGAIACGVFMILMALAGIYGAVKHHQIILFFVSN
ncbi:Tetraspanin-31 [Acropora cervicornis]|uniref:Tetraspanin-31 n=1 Tax=Acropora cervicornis TaxID=6130 RepID=A0AAD9QHH0_ACRCE|nr:Tetraspanin-31 [Acropora cervicornis]